MSYSVALNQEDFSIPIEFISPKLKKNAAVSTTLRVAHCNLAHM